MEGLSGGVSGTQANDHKLGKGVEIEGVSINGGDTCQPFKWRGDYRDPVKVGGCWGKQYLTTNHARPLEACESKKRGGTKGDSLVRGYGKRRTQKSQCCQEKNTNFKAYFTVNWGGGGGEEKTNRGEKKFRKHLQSSSNCVTSANSRFSVITHQPKGLRRGLLKKAHVQSGEKGNTLGRNKARRKVRMRLETTQTFDFYKRKQSGTSVNGKVSAGGGKHDSGKLQGLPYINN